MKKLYVRLISLCLSVAMLFTFATNALAAPSRNTGKVKYLSEVALIEAKNAEEAQAVLAELKKAENGGFEAMIDMDLNEGGKSVYLVYKSSENVDDAITDLAVMNMNGDYSIGNYEQLYNKTLSGYEAITEDYRVIAAAFKKNYEAGVYNAKIAYRQMNYYFVERDGVRIYMGDYMLNFPEDNAEFAKMLFGGNLRVIANVRALMGMGIAGGGVALADRIKDAYADAEQNKDAYNLTAYDAAAEAILADLTEMKKAISNLPEKIKALEADKTSEDAEMQISMLQQQLDRANAFYSLLCEIPVGDGYLSDLVMLTPVLTNEMLYPIVAAGTEAERLLMEYHSLNDLLLYTRLSLAAEDLDAALVKLEEGMEPISVYHGVQNDLIDGSVGVTGDADMASSSTGKNYLDEYSALDLALEAAVSGVFFVAGIGSMLGSIAYMAAKEAANAAASVVKLQSRIWSMQSLAQFQLSNMKDYAILYGNAMKAGNTTAAQGYQNAFLGHFNSFNNAQAEMDKAMQLMNAGGDGTLKAGQTFVGGFLVVLGIACMIVSIANIVRVINKYFPNYSEIPDNMVDVVSNDTYGDRFINYNNAKSYYLDDGKLKSRENDLNAYDGRFWVSLYYTKNYEAGKCLTTTADLIAEESPRAGYSPVHHFGRSSNYNLNSYCDRENAPAVYLAFKYSNNQKSAVTDVPDVIGSAFAIGACAISGFAGIGIGIGLMALVKRKKEEN